ncbi:peptide ABC transporter permease [Candidatus Magnetomorum sp. HK-1]|nr:peptide ABC transporter permease [Candidatus Magnetomorum sp. HK-1]
MLAFILRRCLFLVFVLLGISLLIFGILTTFSPERRAAAYVQSPQQAKNLPAIIKQYGLDQPYYVQYMRWLQQTFQGNFGWSLVSAQPVWNAFCQYLPITLELNLYAVPLTLFLGIFLGTLSGIHRGAAIDHITRILAIVGWSLPTFLFALVLLMIFYGYFGWFGTGVISDDLHLYLLNHPDEFIRYTGLYTIDGILNLNAAIFIDAFKRLLLPITTQVFVVVALLMRITRSSMIEELSKDYITTARAKGADDKTVHYKHAQKNALIPTITVSGQLVALSMEGSVAVEIVFNRHGMGWWLVSSATQLDMPVLMFMCMFMGFIFVLSNLACDLLIAYWDPRIRLSTS